MKDVNQLCPLKTNQRKQVLGLTEQIDGRFKELPLAVGVLGRKNFTRGEEGVVSMSVSIRLGQP